MSCTIYWILATVTIACLIGIAQNASTKLKTENTITQHLDHFNITNNKNYKMRYFLEDKYYKEGGPLIIVIGGEWKAVPKHMHQGPLHKMGQKHSGLLVASEHRFYGNSFPSMFIFEKQQQMRFLSADQAMEDLAYLIQHLKDTVPGLNTSKVVVGGCSYAGMLATWMRMKYPHLVDMAYASSAPIAVGMEYPEYFEVVHDAYANVSYSCISSIKKGVEELKQLVATPTGLKKVREALKSWNCGDLDDMSGEDIVSTVQRFLNTQSNSGEYEVLMCLIMSLDAAETTAFERLAHVIVIKSKERPCTGGTFNFNSVFMQMSWVYQLCTEQGTFQTMVRGDPIREAFTSEKNIKEFLDMCKEQFNVSEAQVRRGVAQTNRRFGGLNPSMTHLLSIQGTYDPWKYLGLLQDLNPESPTIVINGGHHCSDFYDEDENDPETVKLARKKASNIFTRWLSE